MADTDFDVIVIGAGPGGYVAAIRAAQLGLKTACVESRETLGGTCLNVGCIPSKALLHASELYEEAHSGALAKWGVKTSGLELDLDAMHGSRLEAIKGLTGGIEFLFKKNKVTWLKGHAKFTGKDSIDVAGTAYRAKNFVIATGSSVTPLPGVEIDHDRIVDSTSALELEQVPEDDGRDRRRRDRAGARLGLAAARRAGHGRRVSRPDPPRHGRRRPQGGGARSSRSRASPSAPRPRSPARRPARTASPSPSSPPRAARPRRSRRTPSSSRSAAGPTPTASTSTRPASHSTSAARSRSTTISGPRSPASTRSATSRPGPMLAHKAEDEGIAVAEILAGQIGIVNHDVIPSVVYTMPEIAGVGLTEEEAKAAGHEVKVGKFPMMAQQPRQDQPGGRRLRQGDRRREVGPGARHLDHRLGRRHDDRRRPRWPWSSARPARTSPTPATPTRPIRRRSRKRRWR